MNEQESGFYHEPYDGAFDDDEWFDCGMTPSGSCMKAGSEECDFECPFGALGKLKDDLRRRSA